MAAFEGKKSTAKSAASAVVEVVDAAAVARRELTRTRVAAARERVRAAAVLGADDPLPLLRELADDLDDLLATLFATVAPPGGGVALVALGSYGRRELFPYSDVDLLLIHQQLPDASIERIVEAVVYPLWDARMSVGHAVRGIDETLDLAGEDLTLRTALLDARLVAGDAGPFHALAAGAYREVFGPERLSDFQGLLAAERRQRHERFGATVHLLEPNIKSGAGGLRDINTGLWAAKARFGVRELEDLAAAGAATARQQEELLAARRLLQRLRLAMHVATGRAQDRLLFELQEQLAPALFPAGELGVRPLLATTAPAVLWPTAERPQALGPAVERMMHAFYRAARTVVLESEGLLQRCVSPRSRASSRRALDEQFEEVDGQLQSVAPQRFWEEPAELLRAFVIARDEGLPLGRALQDTIGEAAAGEAGAQLPADERAAALFWQILLEPEPEAERLLLERMHDLGVLAALIPEFEPCTGRVQHDLYHVYTVDRHTLYVVGWLKRLQSGRLTVAHPHARSVLEQLAGLDALLLAALLHDVAKPLGTRHAEKGARLAAGVAARLGLPGPLQQEVVFLVRQHLSMQHVSQRRDLGDGAVIEHFAREVGDLPALRRLYLLALADTAMTAPGNLTEWKASLLEQLYERTARRLRGEPAALPLEGPAGIAARRHALRQALLPQHGAAGDELVDRLPEDLLVGQPLAALVHHAGVLLEFEVSPGTALRVGPRAQDDATTVLTVCCADGPGLLASITGALFLHRIDVLAAQVYTIPAGRRGSDRARSDRALDIFWVPAPAHEDSPWSWDAFAETLGRVLAGELDIASQLATRLRPPGFGDRVVPRVETRVALDAESSRRGTIVDLQAADRPGLLYAVTHTLSDLGLEIVASRVATEAGRAVDTFYVRDRRTRRRVRDARRLAAIGDAVRAAAEQRTSLAAGAQGGEQRWK